MSIHAAYADYPWSDVVQFRNFHWFTIMTLLKKLSANYFKPIMGQMVLISKDDQAGVFVDSQLATPRAIVGIPQYYYRIPISYVRET
jgi:hypothetical protein